MKYADILTECDLLAEMHSDMNVITSMIAECELFHQRTVKLNALRTRIFEDGVEANRNELLTTFTGESVVVGNEEHLVGLIDIDVESAWRSIYEFVKKIVATIATALKKFFGSAQAMYKQLERNVYALNKKMERNSKDKVQDRYRLECSDLSKVQELSPVYADFLDSAEKIISAALKSILLNFNNSTHNVDPKAWLDNVAAMKEKLEEATNLFKYMEDTPRDKIFTAYISDLPAYLERLTKELPLYKKTIDVAKSKTKTIKVISSTKEAKVFSDGEDGVIAMLNTCRSHYSELMAYTLRTLKYHNFVISNTDVVDVAI